MNRPGEGFELLDDPCCGRRQRADGLAGRLCPLDPFRVGDGDRRRAEQVGDPGGRGFEPARLTATRTRPASNSRASSRARIASAMAASEGVVTTTQAEATTSGRPASARRPAGQSTTTVP